MSCWVVPAIAAEMWGVTVGHVLSRIRDGSVATRHEHGFTFVDVAPGSHTYHRPRRPDEPKPVTFVAIEPREDETLAVASQQDLPAFQPSVETVSPPEPLPWVEEAAFEPPPADELPPLDEEEDATPLPPRDSIRAVVARQRRRPLAA